MKPTVLFVDDEKNILSSIKRLFFQDDYNLLFAESGKEGLALLLTHKPSVIVTDMRMPEMDGIQFLKAAAPLCPDAVRLVLSGYADIELIMTAVNEGHIWRYITKPWNDADLRVTLKNAMQYYEKSVALKTLVEQLAKKSKELEIMNDALEIKVTERTWQLQERTNLLNQILDNAPLSDVLQRACQVIAQTMGAKRVLILAPALDQTASNQAGPPSSSEIALAEKAMTSNKTALSEAGAAFPMANPNGVLGAVVMCCNEAKNEQAMVKALDGLFSVVRIALSQQKMLKDAPQLLTDIDRIIGEI